MDLFVLKFYSVFKLVVGITLDFPMSKLRGKILTGCE